MKSHEYGGCIIYLADDGMPEVYEGDVPLELVLEFMRGKIIAEELEHRGNYFPRF